MWPWRHALMGAGAGGQALPSKTLLMAQGAARYHPCMMERITPILTILAGIGLALGSSAELRAQAEDESGWRSLRYSKTNMRAGPGGSYPIEWEYKREGMPVRVLRIREAWLYVEEIDGTKGWISESQLSKARGVLVTGEGEVTLHEEPSADSKLKWRAEPGVVARLNECQDGWCEIDVSGRTGWVAATRLWGDEDNAASEAVSD